MAAVSNPQWIVHENRALGARVESFARTSSGAFEKRIIVNGVEDTSPLLRDDASTLRKKIDAAVQISLVVNIALSAVKIYAFVLSHSLAVLASLMDSLLDLALQLVLLVTERNIRLPVDGEYPVRTTWCHARTIFLEVYIDR